MLGKLLEGGDNGVEYFGNHYRRCGHRCGIHPSGHLVVDVRQGVDGVGPHPPDLDRCWCPHLFHQRDQIKIKDREGRGFDFGKEIS